ncbi:hypothetical protein TA3x_003939 [Tundrisphaera sp. TA3]|uniref:hypothetical protein n=1 Tax=Tundrisphaera sp. TA3 TaxID=3435775 RepID=UPI003EBE45BE
MGEIDDEARADASRRFMSLRRRSCRFFLGMPVFWLMGVITSAVCERFWPAGKAIMAVPLLGFLTCWVGAALAWSGLTEFRCPRCGKRFIMSWSNTLPTAACKHCGLYLGRPRRGWTRG